MELENIANVYFDEYENLEVHQLMLEDCARNLAYKNAILNNKSLFKDKVVLDVGAGTGILSIFCAQASALKVYAVEANNLHVTAKEVVKENNFEHIIEVVHNKIEDFKLQSDEKVDIIVSEWMGFYLLHEGMLDSIVFARDNFLKPGGLIFPGNATIYCAPCSVPSLYDFWENINGVSMKSVGQKLCKTKSQKPDILQLRKENLLSEGKPVFWVDLNDVTIEELNMIYHQEIVPSSKDGRYQGLCLWFSVQFPCEENNSPEILSTDPCELPTHWKQTVIVLPNEIKVEKGSPIAYEIFIKRNDSDARRYNIELVMLDPESVTHPEPCDCHMTKCILIKKMLEQYEQKNS